MNDAMIPPPEAKWEPEKIGRALRYLHVLANTPPNEWRTKTDIYKALAEFRDGDGASQAPWDLQPR